MTDKIIEVSNLSKQFKEVKAVNNLSLNVFRGDVFGFLGPNGAGKSTTIRMLLSLISPTEGDIKIFGKPLKAKRNDILRKIGAIVEKPDFYGYLSAFKNLEILGKLSGTNTSKNKIMETLELVGLEKRFKSKVKTYSHGMKQRLGIAQALLHDPDLIILDEPTTGLDPQGMKEIRELILYLSKEKNKTIFLSSHILYEVELVANRMIILNKGTTQVEGYVEDLLNANELKVTFRVGDKEKALKLINENYWIKKLESQIEDRFVFNLAPEEISVLNKYFVQNDIPVNAVVPMRSLEEYFLKLTDKEA
ncbi:MAG: bacitracin ABC transporter ATP-binding protein [Ignavibacteria bacterium GWA2_35_9]|nr:MAG: bacitracin ABC transporter ATP-binding protein [Ignavibacteria bacterium GWA2_35_9]OGU47299.1 MAG: bacitracin ABC transporter ATP-binding protein [Ignavibacteria bacterium GWB2_36_8]OGU52076.1 MAG: bacitracin ABC transporter ATP-binding protein [Ignavibacteria bacterium GWC2_36_12]OGU95534.1 MAG: bacitracin ABC transporter ATP-binding protein [Ignavibacteria bacterium RIFOXYB2_FULL_36_7]